MGILMLIAFVFLSGSKNSLECVPGSTECNVPELIYKFPAVYTHTFLESYVDKDSYEIEDISLTDENILVTGKGNKSRIVPIGKNALNALNDWLLERKKIVKLSPENNVIFLSKQGNPLSPRTIQYRLKYWALKQGIPENIHPHLLRHSFASHILQSSQDLRAVQELLGHSNISTTQIYTHLDFQHLSKIYDKSHPRAKKK